MKNFQQATAFFIYSSSKVTTSRKALTKTNKEKKITWTCRAKSCHDKARDSDLESTSREK